MTNVQTGRSDALRSLSDKDLDALIVVRREELRQLEEEADSRRLHAKLEAIAMARNLIHAYGIDLAEVLCDEPLVKENAGRQRVKRVQRKQQPAPAVGEPGAPAGGPLSRLPSTIRTVLANQGLRSFRDIAHAVDSGAVAALARMGPTRHRELQAWLRTERSTLADQPQQVQPASEMSPAAVHNPV